MKHKLVAGEIDMKARFGNKLNEIAIIPIAFFGVHSCHGIDLPLVDEADCILK